MSDKKVAEGIIIGNFTLTVPLPPNGAQLQIHGLISDGYSVNDIHARIDDMQAIANRQVKKAMIELTRSKRKAQLEHLDSVRQIYAGLVEQQKSGKAFKSQQKQQYEQGQATIDASLRQIKILEEEIAAMEKEVALTG